MNERALSNGTVQLSCRWVDQAASLQSALETFLWPWFVPSPATAPADLYLTLMPAPAFPGQWREACTEPLLVRQSTAPLFNLAVRSGQTGSGELLAWDDERAVGYHIDQDRAEVGFFGSVETGFIHLIELVRYYSLLVEQARGTLILHGSAVARRDSGEVVGIVGAKGAGKTTTLLSMIASGEYTYFSGDKLLLNLDRGAPSVRGWPDYPHIGIGTLRSHPSLARRLGVALTDAHGRPLAPGHKVLVPPRHFLDAVGAPSMVRGQLVRLLLPKVQERAPAGEFVLDAAGKDRVGMHDLFEWPHSFVTACWHGLPLARQRHAAYVSDEAWAALTNIPWIRQSGVQAPSSSLEFS